MNSFKGIFLILGFNMNWKLGLATLAFSLIMHTPCQAARQFDKNMHNPRTISDTSSMLQDMHGQMKLMQEQLGSLKASQQLLSAENAIKNLTPKVRKLEVHIERIEKQMSSIATFDDFEGLKHDMSDLKSKLSALINAPDHSVESALSAISPTLERMQKQVYYLYETLKTQSSKHEEELHAKMDKIYQRVSQFELDMQDKLQDFQGTGSSLNLIRQALQHNHTLISALKIDIEGLKNEKLGQIMGDIEFLKTQTNKDELIQNLNVLKTHIKKLASVFKNSISSVEEAHQVSEKSMQLAKEVSSSVKTLEASQEKQLLGLKALYKRELALKNQIELVKTCLEQQQAQVTQSVNDVLSKSPLHKVTKAIINLKTQFNLVQEDMIGLKQQQQDAKYEAISCFESLNKQMESFNFVGSKVEAHEAQIGHLYDNDKNKVSKEEFEQLNNIVNVEKQALNLIGSKIEAHEALIARLYDNDKQQVSKQDFEQLHTLVHVEKQSLNAMNTKVDAHDMQISYLYNNNKNNVLKEDFEQLKGLVNFEKQSIQSLQNDLKAVDSKIQNITHFEAQLGGFHDKITHLQKQSICLYKKVKNLGSQADLEDLKRKYVEISSKLQKVDQLLSKDDNHDAVNELNQKINLMEQDLKAVKQKLHEKEEFISKLGRRVNFLTKSLNEKLEQAAPKTGEELSHIKDELSIKIEKELRAVQNDRLLFETLIQRVAALEASLNHEETTQEEQNGI
jgi:phage shock protein A